MAEASPPAIPLSDFAQQTLEKRYLLRNEQGEIIETPYELFGRVARCVASVEEDKSYWSSQFFKLMISGDFVPNTPTLMNAEKENGQLSACFVLPIEDSMEGIFTTLKDAAKVHQTGGGTGFDFSRLRPEGSMVSNKSGVSTGPLAFCTVYDKATEVIKQGASRRGANMMTLRVDHPDILDFIDMKSTPGVMTNFNVSVCITDEFMEAYKHDKQYALKHPFTGTTGALSAVDVFDRIAQRAWESAEPGIIFIDRVNNKSPYWERIESTNPCGEQPLPPYGSCNLGAINLANFVVKENGERYIQWDRLRNVVREATRFLDNVIDVNDYPLSDITDNAKRYRNIGLGVMGWADMLIQLKISYTSVEAIELGEKVMHFINTMAHQYSYELAKEKGTPSGAPFKTFYDYSHPERRNATLTTVAPTGTTSFFAILWGLKTSGVSSGIEPNFAFQIERHQLETVVTEEHPLYRAAKNNGGIGKEFIEAHEVDVKTHVDMQAAFQKNCDSAISKTINLHETTTIEDVKYAYLRAWETGCKGITVYREGSREGILHKVQSQEDDSSCCDTPSLRKQDGCETCDSCGFSVCLIA